jgi:hypothetical protein
VPEMRVSYKGRPDQALTVNEIQTWQRGEIDHAILSASSGPKDYFKNLIFDIFENVPTIDAITLVRANGPPFLIARVGQRHFDMSKGRISKEVVCRST